MEHTQAQILLQIPCNIRVFTYSKYEWLAYEFKPILNGQIEEQVPYQGHNTDHCWFSYHHKKNWLLSLHVPLQGKPNAPKVMVCRWSLTCLRGPLSLPVPGLNQCWWSPEGPSHHIRLIPLNSFHHTSWAMIWTQWATPILSNTVAQTESTLPFQIDHLEQVCEVHYL